MKNSLNRWHVASVMPPVDITFDGKYRYQGWIPCIEWCEQTFGDMCSSDRPARWRFVSEGVFEFKHERDLTAFLLKWT
jgi:hypothetical protein